MTLPEHHHHQAWCFHRSFVHHVNLAFVTGTFLIKTMEAGLVVHITACFDMLSSE